MADQECSAGDESLETLLHLDGEVFPMDNGFWTKFEAYKVEPSEYVPYGVRYSLTLHDNNNTRILGFDNAHAYKPKKGNMGLKKSRGITNTKGKRSHHMNMNLPVSCWRIFGWLLTR